MIEAVMDELPAEKSRFLCPDRYRKNIGIIADSLGLPALVQKQPDRPSVAIRQAGTRLTTQTIIHFHREERILLA
jgi:hypothetical protein